MTLHGVVRRMAAAAEACWRGRWQDRYGEDLSFTDAAARFPDRNALYAYANHHFRHLCPAAIRLHRAHFRENHRGFGENAFHALWWLLLREFRPRRCLEIGVYRGQVISLWAFIAKTLEFQCEVHGISPFAAAGDAVSLYQENVDYLADTVESFDAFGLPSPTLVKALSTDPRAVQHISAIEWDLIYIDGSHDYEVVLADYALCRKCLKPGGLLVLDDASLGTSFRPPLYSFAGHPGPSRVAAEHAMKDLDFVGAVGHNNVFRKPDPSMPRIES